MLKKLVTMLMLIVLLAACAPKAISTEPAQVEAVASKAPDTAAKQAEPTPADQAKAAETCTEPVTLDFYMVGGGETPARESVEAALNEYIAPMCMKVAFHIVAWGDWTTKAIPAIQSGEKIDVFFTADWYFYNELVAQGLLLPLNDPNGPNGNLFETYGQGILSTLNPAFITGTQINGVNYAVPVNKELAVPLGYLYNQTVADEIGFTKEDAAKIKSMRDYEPWLEKARAAHPDVYPYLLNFQVGFDPRVPGFANAVPQNIITMKNDPDDNGIFDETIYNFVETAWFKDYVETIWSWKEKGWVNPEAAIQGYEDTPLFNAGKFFVEGCGLKGGTIKSDEMVSSSGNPDLKVSEYQTQKKVVVTLHTGGSMYAIPKMSEYPVQAMKFINLLHTDPKALNIALFGVEGVHWKLDPDGRVNLIDSAWYGGHAGAWVWGDTQIQYVTNKEDPDKAKKLIEFSNDALMHPSLGFRFVKAPVEAEITAIQTVIDKYWNPLVYGYIDPATELPKFIEELKTAGIDTVQAEVQKQYDTWKAAVQE